MKRNLLIVTGVLGAVALMAFAFGFFDDELADERRWAGIALLVAGVAVAIPAMRRLAEDWPRLKPVHNVDVAFVQIGIGVFMLTLALWMGGRPWALLSPLAKPTPQMQQVPDQPPATAGTIAGESAAKQNAPGRR